MKNLLNSDSGNQKVKNYVHLVNHTTIIIYDNRILLILYVC